MKNKIYFVLLASLLFPCISFAYEKELKELSTTLAENIANSGKKSIAVVDFVNLNGQVTDGGRFFAEEFTVNLAAAGKGFEVIERSRLNTILAEYKLASTGIIDPNTAKKLGQIAGVDAVITGTTTLLGDKIRLSVKVLAVDTAQVITAASTTITKTKENEDIWKLFTTTATTETTTTENPQPADDGQNQFVGSWINIDPNTQDITRVIIGSGRNQISVKMWGKCHPSDCYWNEYPGVIVKTSFSGSVLFVDWIFSFENSNQELTILPSGLLKINTHTHYTERSGVRDRDIISYFRLLASS